MDKINILSSQAVLEMSSFSMVTHSMSSSSLVSMPVKNRLFKTATDIDELPLQFILTVDLSLVQTTLYDSPLLLQIYSVNSFMGFFGAVTQVPSFDQNLIFVAEPYNHT